MFHGESSSKTNLLIIFFPSPEVLFEDGRLSHLNHPLHPRPAGVALLLHVIFGHLHGPDFLLPAGLSPNPDEDTAAARIKEEAIL